MFRLTIYFDDRHEGLVAACARTVEAVMANSRVGILGKHGSACTMVTSYSKAWPRLLPQHGPGRKHTRPISLQAWQEDIVADHPEAFLRGLIHSDGWRGVNRVSVRGRTYHYTRYIFTNRSADILALFCRTCVRLGVRWRRMNERNISVARRADVARLDEFVGPKL